MKSVQKIKKLLSNKYTLMSAESCTGGLISSYLTDVSGSSNFIKSNFVTYSFEAKNEILGVKFETIEKYNVVSPEVALEMVKGLIKRGSDFGISTTGILGPTGFDDKRPIGLCYIGLGFHNKFKTIKYISNKKGRISIKKDIAKYALDVLSDFIEENVGL